MYTSLKPFVPSGGDYALAQQFFRDIGFTMNWDAGELCEMQADTTIFLLQNFDNKAFQENYMVYVTVADLEAYYQQLCASRISECYPGVRFSAPEDRPWGVREVHLIDPAGVCWHFTEHT